ncbi:unnamed protein product [Vitrella brassicaformis CCMP3155]|uniref:Uncharacterized protein n=1 Tax=Vitrella brassicaformis (strain CCMP3155) TaxID=1169540 RepID=A0A0G4EA83_VITBC|nr:unnamed protein product [Vitrella brassicaformis CCMP3155]|eukprot:CEL92862.1 unnamed protein product [Vitrella brassicaformis CCMP3155]
MADDYRVRWEDCQQRGSYDNKIDVSFAGSAKWDKSFGIPSTDPKAAEIRQAYEAYKQQLEQKGLVYVGGDGREYLRVGEGAAAFGVGLVLLNIVAGNSYEELSKHIDQQEAAADEQEDPAASSLSAARLSKSAFRRDIKWALRWAERLAAMRAEDGSFISLPGGHTPLHKRDDPELACFRPIFKDIEELAVECLSSLPCDRPPLAGIMDAICTFEGQLFDALTRKGGRR